jgi:hypothetical protein
MLFKHVQFLLWTDQISVSLPNLIFSAILRAGFAAIRSCVVLPTDLKTYIASDEIGPMALPMVILPVSAWIKFCFEYFSDFLSSLTPKRLLIKSF